MTTNLSTDIPTKKPWYKKVFTLEFWQKQNNWLLLLIIMLVGTLIIYLSVHSLEQFTAEKANKYFDDPHEAEYKTMDNADISHITALINAGSTFIPTANLVQVDSTTGEQIVQAMPNVRFKDNPNCRVVKDYVLSQLPYVYPQDTAKIFSLLDEQPNSLAVSFIETARFRVKSYFWLSGPHTYLEIIFWTIFGVLTSILFYIGAAIANGTGFKPEETPGHLAKIAYSPFISLIIIFSYNLISNPDSFLDVSASKGTLIVSFLLGFYSSRAMKLLDKLKDVVLPYGENTSADNRRQLHEAEVTAAAQNMLENQASNVEVDITLNDPAHPDAEDLNNHIGQTQVLLIPDEEGEPIQLQKTGDDEQEGIFTANNVQQGNYTLTATLSTTDGGNYQATQPIQVINGQNTYTIALNKTDANG